MVATARQGHRTDCKRLPDMSIALFYSSESPTPTAGSVQAVLGHGYISITLIVVEIDVLPVSSTSAEVTITKLQTLFATHGIPEHIVSDNGPGFVSEEFWKFTSGGGIMHITTSPYHPSSNGLVEHAVQTFKTSVKKLDSNMEHRLACFLLQYRITPHTVTGKTSSEMLMGRKLRTKLDLMHPDSCKKILETQLHQKESSKAKSWSFCIDDSVFARNYQDNHNSKWVLAQVIRITGPVSYHVMTEEGLVWRRHVDQLKSDHSRNESNVDNSETLDEWPFCPLSSDSETNTDPSPSPVRTQLNV